MNWYYAEENERRGPLDETAFQALVRAGTVTPETLVWQEGMAGWVPYREVAGVAAAAQAISPAGPVVVAAGTRACSECGRSFPADEMISYENRAICAECKPLFFQRVREGAVASVEREYAGFWLRVGAKIVDGILLNIVGQMVGLAVKAVVPDPVQAGYLAAGIAFVLGLSYAIFFVGRYGATPGKMACKIQIIRADDSPMTYGRATARYFAELVSAMALLIGYIMVAFDPEKRALHDRICDTRVVRKR